MRKSITWKETSRCQKSSPTFDLQWMIFCIMIWLLSIFYGWIIEAQKKLLNRQSFIKYGKNIKNWSKMIKRFLKMYDKDRFIIKVLLNAQNKAVTLF
jgi:hypothetical protein